MAKFYPISYSGLVSYEKCPYSFYRQKIMEPKVKDTALSPALIHGTKMHKILEDYVTKDAPIPAENANLEPVARVVGQMKMFPKARVQAERGVYITKDRQPLRHKKFFDNFFASWLNAKIDLTVIIGDTAHIKDYKTGKSDGDKFQLDIQAACLLADAPEVTRVTTQFVYVDRNQFSDIYTHERGTEWTEEIMERTQDYEYGLANDIFPAKPSPRACRFCPVRDCQHNKRVD